MYSNLEEVFYIVVVSESGKEESFRHGASYPDQIDIEMRLSQVWFADYARVEKRYYPSRRDSINIERELSPIPQKSMMLWV